MSAHIPNTRGGFFSAQDLAAFGPPIGFDRDGNKIDTQADAADRMTRFYHRQLQLGHISVGANHRNGRRDERVCADAAEVFWVNNLQQELSTISRAPTSSGVMTGPNAVLPIRQTLRMGQTELAWDIETPTGGATFLEPGAMRKLPMVGEFSEREVKGSAFTGIGYGADLIESWQAAEKGGPPILQLRAASAMASLTRFNERVSLFGDPGHEISGLHTNSQSYMLSMGNNFVSLAADADAAQVKLQIMEHAFTRIGKEYGGTVNTVLAPLTDKYAFQRMRWTNDDAALPDFLEMHDWMSGIRWIDGLQTAASSGGPVWIMMDVDPDELWNELSPTPMMFGPFGDGITGSYFVLISHIGGVILRRRERMIRYEYAA